MKRVRYSLRRKFNLLNYTRRLIYGWDLGGERITIWLRNNEQTIKFDIKINTKKGIIFVSYVNQYFLTQEVATLGSNLRINVNTTKAHELLGNMNEDSTRAAEKALGWEIIR